MALRGLTAILMAVYLAKTNVANIGVLVCLSGLGAFITMFCKSLPFICIAASVATAFRQKAQHFWSQAQFFLLAGLHPYWRYSTTEVHLSKKMSRAIASCQKTSLHRKWCVCKRCVFQARNGTVTQAFLKLSASWCLFFHV